MKHLSPAEQFTDPVEFTKKADRAIKKALREHQKADRMIAVWRDGKAVLIRARDVQL